MTQRLFFLLEHLDLPAATGVDDARWEGFQLDHLRDESPLRIVKKARQIAWSFTTAAEGMADAINTGRDAIYVSINQAEAAEKIRYARAVYQNLNASRLPRLRRDNVLGLELSNGARLDSLPGKAPRGRARANIYLDEYAHVRLADEIYTGALPIISKGGRIRIGSSAMGASGKFWEIYTQSLRPYPGYTRRAHPWWETYAFCTDPLTAIREAPALDTATRVYRFGNDRIVLIFENMPLEDFQQEYETEFIDESSAWITWEEIREAQDPDLICHMATARPGDLAPALAAIDALREDLRLQRVEMAMGAGYDVGRTRNTSELYAVGWSPANSYPLRLAVTLDNLPFDDQETILRHACRILPLAGLNIDRNGIGMQLAESMEARFPAVARGVDFTNPAKVRWATEAKKLIQQHRTPLPVDRDLAYQIHSIKRKVSAAGNLIFDTEGNDRHHADKFWAWALALATTTADGFTLDPGLAQAYDWMQR